jgi:two-component system, OmpR family, response regulator CpxR
MTAGKNAILLIDDDADLGSLMREFFEQHGFDVTASADPQLGLKFAQSGQYSLVVLDVMMPRMDGFEVLRQLRATSLVPVLMLTARTEAASRIRGLEGGADDYLPKPFDPLELLARVKAILRRAQPAAAATVVDASGVRLDPQARQVRQNGAAVDLTSIEFDILDTLLRAAGRVISRNDLMQRLYQRDATPFDRSIDVHVSHLRRKLADGERLIRTVRGVGYQFCLDETP